MDGMDIDTVGPKKITISSPNGVGKVLVDKIDITDADRKKVKLQLITEEVNHLVLGLMADMDVISEHLETQMVSELKRLITESKKDIKLYGEDIQLMINKLFDKL